MRFKLVWPFVLPLAFAVCAFADEPRLALNTGGHTSIIKDVVFTRDGKYLISAGDDKVIRVWEVETGRLARTIQGEIGDGNEGKIFAMALSPDERYLAVGGWLAGEPTNRQAIRLHDFRSGAVGLLKGHEDVINALAFSPDGRYLVSGSGDRTARVWDLETRPMKQAHLLSGHADAIYAVAFSPDGRRIVTGSDDDTLKLWDVASGTLVKELEKRHSDDVSSVAFSPDGRYLVSGGGDKKVLLWDGQTGNFIKELHRQETTVNSLSFSPDGSRLLTGSGEGGSTVCYTLAFPSGAVVTRFEKHDNIVLATAFSPDGKLAATAGGDNNLIHLWNPEDGQIIRTLGGKGQKVWSVGFARDGQSIAYGNEFDYKNIHQKGPLQRIVTLQTGADYQVTLGGAVRDEAAFARAITSVGDYTLKTTNDADPNLQIVRNGKVEHRITRDAASGFNHRCYTLTRDGRQLVSGGAGGVLALYETQTGAKQRDFIGHTNTVWAVAVSPDNRMLVSGSADQTVRLWDIATGRNLLTIFVAADNEWVAWTPEGYYADSLNGDRYIGWHVNRGVDQAAEYYSAAQFKSQFYRPDVVLEYLRTRGDLALALKTANEQRGGGSAAAPNAAAPNILSLIPPVVFIRSPRPDESVVENGILTVEAEAEAAPNTLPVSSLKVLLNGLQVAATKGAQLEVQVLLRPGPNTIEVIAANEKAVSAPKTKKVIYTGQPAVAAKPNLIFLALGVAEYARPEFNLKFAAQDALEMAERFKAQEGGFFNQVKIEALTDKQVTREAVLDKLDWLAREAKQDDVVVLYLSGHAGTHRNSYYFYTHQHDPNVHPELYDVKWSVLMDALSAAPRTKRILFVDTPRAGAATGGARAKGDEGLLEALKDLQQSYQGVVFFAASANNEPSIEKDELKHGLFTYALLEGLKGNADVMKRDQIIYINELGNFVRERVKQLSGGAQHTIYYEPPPESGFQPFPLYVLPKQR